MIEIKSHKDTATIGLGSWSFNDKIIYSTITEFSGNCLCVYDDNCLNEISIYFGYRPQKDATFDIIDCKSMVDVGKNVFINIFSEDKTQWHSVGGHGEKLHVKILGASQMCLSFSGIKMQTLGSSPKRVLICSGIIQEKNDFPKELKKFAFKKLLSMRDKNAKVSPFLICRKHLMM